MQSNYKNNTLPFADISAKYQTEMDKVDITSKETIQVETVNKSDYNGVKSVPNVEMCPEY